MISVLGVAVFTISSLAQTAPNESEQPVRVNVTINPDGTRTTYQFDYVHRQATATTTTAEGKLTRKIQYEIDEAGRFSSGLVYSADDKLLFKSVYKYTPEGRLDQESHLKQDDTFINKIVYSYDSSGRQTGYVVVDASGKIIAQTSPAQTKSSPPPKPKKRSR